MAQPPQDFLSNDFSHPHHRKAIAALIVAVLVFGIAIVVYIFRPAPEVVPVAPPPDPNELTQAKIDKLAEMSQSLTVQEITPQLKAKLAEMSKSLNK